MNSKRTIFISDLHLEASRSDITERFLHLLKNCDASVEALYILGDLFEVWIGDDDLNPFHHTIIQALKSASEKGLIIYFMHGNRDFLVGKRFLKASGCRVLNEETKISLYNTPVLLMHGDTLCTRDICYLKARKKLRNRLYQTLYLALPLFMRRKMAESIRKKSERHTHTTALEVMDVTQSQVEEVMQKHGVQYLIHGHTHRPMFHEFSRKCTTFQRIVLGAWHEKGNMLIWEETGQKKWVEF